MVLELTVTCKNFMYYIKNNICILMRNIMLNFTPTTPFNNRK